MENFDETTNGQFEDAVNLPLENGARANNDNDTEKCSSVSTGARSENKKEILEIKKKLEKDKLRLMEEIDRLETERLTLQESASLTHSQILQQQQVLVFGTKDICQSRSNQITKHYEEEIFKVDKCAKELLERNAEIEDIINYIAEAIDEAKADFLGDALVAVKLKTEDGVVSREVTPPKLVFPEFKVGEIKLESLSAMIGSVTVTDLTQEAQSNIVSKFMEGVPVGSSNRLLGRTRAQSVESSSTQISSGDLTEHNSVATQTDGEGEQGSLGITEGTIVFTVNIDDIDNSLDRCMESTPVNVKGLSWRLVVYRHWRDQLQIRIYYKNLELIDKSVEYVEYGYICKLVNHTSDTWSICKRESHKIGRDAWWDSVISWHRLEDSHNGYVKNKWFTVEAKITVEDVRFY